MNGIWGQLSVGLFADPQTGPKGILLGGGPYQLVVQAISSISLTIWAMCATLTILWIVDHVLPIRLSPEDEKKGCDLTEHYFGERLGNEVQKSLSTIDKIINITTPITQRFTGSTEERSQRELDNFGRRKPFHSNRAFEEEQF